MWRAFRYSRTESRYQSWCGAPGSNGTCLLYTSYITGCFGKWHLGDLKGHLPTDQGFDYYYGIPYSNEDVYKRQMLVIALLNGIKVMVGMVMAQISIWIIIIALLYIR